MAEGGKHSVKAKFVRTFLMSAAGGLTSLQTVDFLTDWRTGASQVGIVLVGALLAAVLAAVQAAFPPTNAKTPFAKAGSQFAQHLVGTLGGAQLVELTGDALLKFGDQVGRAAIAAAFAAVISLATNLAEG
ncbi:MAG TPA: hypothetical protein VG318_08205 [Actinomycetota bacterium]|nr:hypothetical protein [Actinomycetota bacterium]